MPHDVIEQLSPIAVLHDHVQLFFGLNDLIELYNIWMSDLLKNLDFSRNALHIFLIMDLVLFKDFNGNLYILIIKLSTYLFSCESMLA